MSTFSVKVSIFLVNDVNDFSTEKDDFIAILPPLPPIYRCKKIQKLLITDYLIISENI